jgi:hypothetical protein
MQMSGPPHHPRHDVGMSQKAHDHRAVPLCMEHHEDAQRYRLAGMDKYKMRVFFDDQGEQLRTRYLQQQGGNDAGVPRED